MPPAISERVTDCWPSVALTVVLATVVISAGSAPALIRLARVVAESVVKSAGDLGLVALAAAGDDRRREHIVVEEDRDLRERARRVRRVDVVGSRRDLRPLGRPGAVEVDLHADLAVLIGLNVAEITVVASRFLSIFQW